MTSAEGGESTTSGNRMFNINVGVLGHVDSGKTSLVRALSTTLSTAALDKHPQSIQRGITLDLGFSACHVACPASLAHLNADKIQFTLVDCPGHASLIRTIIGGAQIIDIMLLVVDAVKGVQVQTAECLVIGEISPTNKMVVVMNKIDLLPLETRQASIDKMKKRLRATLKGTKFASASIVAAAASPGGSQDPAASVAPQGVDDIITELIDACKDVRRVLSAPFLFAIDHCFAIKGQGTVLTGTILEGSVKLNDTIELPVLKIQRKVKSMQMFHQPVTAASKGDRVAICVTQLDSSQIERGLAAAVGSVPTFSAAVASASRIPFFKSAIKSKTKFHISVGHLTVMAEALFFRDSTAASEEESQGAAADGALCFDFCRRYQYLDELPSIEDQDDSAANLSPSGPVWVLLRFATPVVCPPHALFIASRLDMDINTKTCRLAFHGQMAAEIDSTQPENLQALQVFKTKRKEGLVDRVVDSHSLICRGLVKKDGNISQLLNLQVSLPTGETGTIQSSFGKSGKCKIIFSSPLPAVGVQGSTITLEFKKFIFDRQKCVRQ